MIFYGLFGAFILGGAFSLKQGLANGDVTAIAVGVLFLLAGIVPMLASWLHDRRRGIERKPPRGETLAFRLVPTAPPRRDAASQQAAAGWIFIVVAALFGVVIAANWNKMDEEILPIAIGIVAIAGGAGLLVTVLDVRRRARRRAGGGAYVEVAQHPVAPGQRVKILVKLEETLQVTKLEVIAEAFQRFATRGTGSDRRTKFHAVAGTALEVPIRDGTLLLPADAPPSEGRAMQWFITLRGQRDGDEWERCFALEVGR